ncbi:MAG: glycoside hydrolase family 97 protein [Acidobacteria bacterium]|nr:MAG: glycoside hydrolase family 97 protein [Acidobacteriota bacterium]
MRVRLRLLLFGMAFITTLHPALAESISSPDGKIRVEVGIKQKLEPYPSGVRLYYSVLYNSRTLLADSPFRIDFKGMPPIAENLAVKGSRTSQGDQTWQTVWGKSKTVGNRFNELTLSLEESAEPHRRLDFVVRAFDDGVAFRYHLPAQPALTDFRLAEERSEFHFPGNPTVWAATYDSFQTHQETEFVKRKLADIKPGEIIGCPLLLETPAGWAALTEADLTDWAGLYFTGSRATSAAVVSVLSPRLDEPDVAVISRTPRSSPWRVLMVGGRPGDLVESSIILNLSAPCALEDTSWIEPGVATWDRWWCGSYAPDFPGELGMGTESMKYFVDFAAEMGWKYQLVDWTWYGPPFDPAKPFGSAGNPNADLTRSIPELDIPGLVQYAAGKGVKILIWLDWFNAEKQMEKAFPLYENWGVKGVKVDFMTRDDQQMVNFYERLVKLAAQHHLTVDFHGAYKPTGLRRTYPNLLTREGVLGNEYNKWSNRVTPRHNVTLPFTRMLCGPMDFTPGGFRHKTVESFRVVGGDTPGPFVMGTRCHQLAMLVVYESPLQVMTDSPYSYRMSPFGLEFLRGIPTTWDETRVLDGYPGEFVVIARRSGSAWYLAAMSGNQGREITIPLHFLGGDSHQAEIWMDAEEAADYPEHVWEKKQAVRSNDSLKVRLAPGGGFVGRIRMQ